VAPLLHRFRRRFAEAEIDRAREELLRAIDLPRRQQFLRTNDSQLRPLLRSDQVLPALPARAGKIGRPHVAAAGEIGQNAGALVVGMGRDHQYTSQLVQFPQRLFQVRSACKWPLLRLQG